MSGRGTFVPLSFAPGEAFQFDWCEDWAILDGVRTKLHVAHFKPSHSRAFTVRAYQIGRAHVCTSVTNAHSVCRLLLETKHTILTIVPFNTTRIPRQHPIICF